MSSHTRKACEFAPGFQTRRRHGEEEPYVVCIWKGRLWPAKVLAQSDRTCRRRKDVGVEILGEEKRVRVPESQVWPLTQDRIESLSLQLAQDVVRPVEELRYRKALRLAINTFSPGDPLPPPPGSPRRSCYFTAAPTPSTMPRPAPFPRSSGPQRPVTPSTRFPPPRHQGAAARRGGEASPSPAQGESGRRRGRPPKASRGSAATPTATATPTYQPTVPPTATPMDPLTLKWTSPRRGRGRRGLLTSSPAPPPEGPCSSTPLRATPCLLRKRLRSATPHGDPSLCPPNSPGSGPAQRQGAESEAEPSRRKPRRAEMGAQPPRGRGRPKGSRSQRNAGTSDTPPVANLGKRGRLEAGQPLPGPAQSTDSDSQPRPRCRARFEVTEESEGSAEATRSSDLSIELSLQEDSTPLGSSLLLEEDESDDEELPSFLLQMERKPLSIKEGICVWCKLRNYPFWPALVKSVNRKQKKASIVFIDNLLLDQKRRRKGFCVALRTLKPFDCAETDELMVKARERYESAFNWCLDLIEDYRMRIGCGSFSGSFMEYFADNISCPVRKLNPVGGAEVTFPSKLMEEEEEEEGVASDEQGVAISSETNQQDPDGWRHTRKRLPDRSEAARNRANHKLVDFIVGRRGAEKRLQAVISGRESSRWLRSFLRTSRPVYLEDDGQVDRVLGYLEGVFQNAPSVAPYLAQVDDSVRFVMNVLLPEALIQAIAGVEKLSLKQAEDKYLKGPCISQREREEFDLMIEKQMRMKKQEELP